MARKPKSRSPQQDPPPVEQGKFWLPSDAEWGGFINIRLDDQQKDEFRTWEDTVSESVLPSLDDLLGEGIKFALSYDRENQCYIATLTGALVVGSNERYCVTTRAGGMFEVIALAMFKHYVLAKEDYGEYKPRSGRFDNWG